MFRNCNSAMSLYYIFYLSQFTALLISLVAGRQGRRCDVGAGTRSYIFNLPGLVSVGRRGRFSLCFVMALSATIRRLLGAFARFSIIQNAVRSKVIEGYIDILLLLPGNAELYNTNIFPALIRIGSYTILNEQIN